MKIKEITNKKVLNWIGLKERNLFMKSSLPTSSIYFNVWILHMLNNLFPLDVSQIDTQINFFIVHVAEACRRVITI